MNSVFKINVNNDETIECIPLSAKVFQNSYDEKLKNLLGIDNDKLNELTYFNIQKYMNKHFYSKKEAILNGLPDLFTLEFILDLAEKDEDKNFKRLCFEYLPLKFSRRHGDPSRPWNKFSINTRSEVDGSKILDYEGNWRDIFQNWEPRRTIRAFSLRKSW